MHSSSQQLAANLSARVALSVANPDVGLAEGKEEKANFELQGVGGAVVGAQSVQHESLADMSCSMDR